VIIEHERNVSSQVPESVRRAMTTNLTHLPVTPNPTLTQRIFPHHIDWVIDFYHIQITFFIKHDGNLFKILTILQIIRYLKSDVSIIAAVAIHLSDILFARTLMRWVKGLGEWLLGVREASWLTTGSLTLFWLADSLVFNRFNIGSRKWLIGLRMIDFWTLGKSVWVTSLTDLVGWLVLRTVAGLLIGLLKAAEEGL
jgi:hypothetical protein